MSKKYKSVKFYLGGWIDDHIDSISKTDLEKSKKIHNFTYLGKLEDVRKAIKKTNIIVLPSYREGMPRIILEAMSCGRPVITTDVPGCRETVVNGKNGFLIKHKSTESLFLAMEKFINNPKLIQNMGKNRRKIVENKFDVKLINKNLLNILFRNV